MNQNQLLRQAYRTLQEEMYALPPLNVKRAAEELPYAEENLYDSLIGYYDDSIAEFLFRMAKDSDTAILAVASVLAEAENDHSLWTEALEFVIWRLKERARKKKGYWRIIAELRDAGQLGDYEP